MPINSQFTLADNLTSLKTSIFQQLKCFALATIIKLDEADNKNIIQVEIGINDIAGSSIIGKQIIWCSAIKQKHIEYRYEVGDVVAIAYSDKNQASYLLNNNATNNDITNCNGCHSILNGVILFPILSFDNTKNDYVKINYDDNESVTIKEGELEAKEGQNNIKMSGEGIDIASGGKIALKNNEIGLLAIMTDLADVLNALAPLDPSGSAVTLLEKYKTDFNKLLK